LPLRFGWLETLTELCRVHSGARAIGAGRTALVNPRAQNGETIDTPAIIDAERATATTLDDLRGDFPIAVLGANASAIPIGDRAVESASWQRDCDRLNIIEPAAGKAGTDPWFLGAGLLSRAAIALYPMGSTFRPGDEIGIEVRYAAIGGWLSIELQAEDTGSTLATSEPFEAQGLRSHIFKTPLPSLARALRIRVALVEPALPDGFDPIVRLDRIALTVKRAGAEIGRARIDRLREATGFDDIDADMIVENFGESRAFMADGGSSFRHEIGLSPGYGETTRCSARYGDGSLIVAVGSRMAVIENPDDADETGIIGIVSEFAQASAAAQD
jgi:hypothetical protein